MEICVTADRRMKTKAKGIGSVGEHNASELRFQLPARIQNIPIEAFSKKLIARNRYGRTEKLITDSQSLRITRDMTRGEWLELQLELSHGDIIWRSEIKMFGLYPSICVCAEDDTAAQALDFKCVLIDSLNQTFGFSFNEDTEAETIVDELRAIDKSDEIKRWFIERINNSAFGFSLSEDMSFDDLALNISMGFDRIGSQMIDYSALKSEVLQIVRQHIDPNASANGEIEPAWLEHILLISSSLTEISENIGRLRNALQSITGEDYSNAPVSDVLEAAALWLKPIEEICSAHVNGDGELILTIAADSPVLFELNNGNLEVQTND